MSTELGDGVPVSFILLSSVAAPAAHFPVAQKSHFASIGAMGTARESAIKIMLAREAKNGFGRMIDTARAAPVLIEKHGRAVVVVMSVEEYERLSRLAETAVKSEGMGGRRSNVANEAFARIKIDQILKDAEWRLPDGLSVRYEYPLDDGGKADYVLFDRQGRALAVLEAKSTSVSLSAGEAQGLRYADLLDVPFIFLSNGEEVWFRDKGQEAHFWRVETIFSQDDLARAARDIRRNPLGIAIDTRIAGGGGRLHQTACIDAVCREIVAGGALLRN